MTSFLRIHGYNTKVIDQIDETIDEILKDIQSFKPSLVGISTMTYNFSNGLLLSQEIKKCNPNIKIFFAVFMHHCYWIL